MLLMILVTTESILDNLGFCKRVGNVWNLGLAVSIVILASIIFVQVYNFFEGETLLADCLDEYLLSRKDINKLDLDWAMNSSRSSIIISLTTIPSRMPHIAPCIKSLLRQTRAPHRIVLNLPRYSRREKCSYVVPKFLLNLQSLDIRFCDDVGPATKLIPTVLHEQSDSKIIVVDDDRIYPANLVEDLELASEKYPNATLGFSGWSVPEDFTDKPTTLWSNFFKLPPSPVRSRRLNRPWQVDILQGMSGYFTRPIYYDLESIIKYEHAPAEAYYVDDVWISAHCKVASFVIPARRSNYEAKFMRRLFKLSSLGKINRGKGGNENRHNSIVLKHFAEKWIRSNRAQFDS